MNPKYEPNAVIQDLKNHNVDIDKFEEVIKRMNGVALTNQAMFEFIYESIVVNNYNIDLFF